VSWFLRREAHQVGRSVSDRRNPRRARFCCALGLLGLFFLAPGGVLFAQEEHSALDPKPLDIHVQVNGSGRVSSADIAAVLKSAAFEIWRYCLHTKLEGIDVYYRPDQPQTDFKRTSSGRIGIGLSARDTHWAQYGFQFAHEFCHALANYSGNPQKLVRYSQQANLWLEESLCETASLFTLKAMSRSWRDRSSLSGLAELRSLVNNYVE